MQAISTVTSLLFLSITALIAADFVPVSLLTTIAQEIGISYGLAGQTVTAVGIMAMLSSLILAPLFMLAAIFVLYLSLGQSIEILPLTVLTFGFGFLPVLWPLWLLKIMPNLTEMVSCLQVAIIQLSVGLAASVGGVMVDDFGLKSLLTISAIVGFVVLSLVPLALPSRLLRAQTALS